jgi:hypothetical protein
MRESKIERHLVQRIDRLKGECIKMGKNGWPDRLIILAGGEILFAELKSSQGKLKPHQKRRVERLRRLGQEVLVPKSIEEIDLKFPSVL